MAAGSNFPFKIADKPLQIEPCLLLPAFKTMVTRSSPYATI